MKEITEKQIEVIKKLAKATKTDIKNVEQMSRFEASKVIEGLLEKLKQMRQASEWLCGLQEKAPGQRLQLRRSGRAGCEDTSAET